MSISGGRRSLGSLFSMQLNKRTCRNQTKCTKMQNFQHIHLNRKKRITIICIINDIHLHCRSHKFIRTLVIMETPNHMIIHKFSQWTLGFLDSVWEPPCTHLHAFWTMCTIQVNDKITRILIFLNKSLSSSAKTSSGKASEKFFWQFFYWVTLVKNLINHQTNFYSLSAKSQ